VKGHFHQHSQARAEVHTVTMFFPRMQLFFFNLLELHTMLLKSFEDSLNHMV